MSDSATPKRDELMRTLERLRAQKVIQAASVELSYESERTPSLLALLGRPYLPGEMTVERGYPKARRKGLA